MEDTYAEPISHQEMIRILKEEFDITLDRAIEILTPVDLRATTYQLEHLLSHGFEPGQVHANLQYYTSIANNIQEFGESNEMHGYRWDFIDAVRIFTTPAPGVESDGEGEYPGTDMYYADFKPPAIVAKTLQALQSQIMANATNAAYSPATPAPATPGSPIVTTPGPTPLFNTYEKSTQTNPMQTNSTASLVPIIVPGQTTMLTSQNLPPITIPTSEQDLERYVQLSMKYGPQRAKSIIKTYGYNPQTTDTTMVRGRHDYTPMSIARYTDFQPEARDLFQRGLNRWGYPIGPRLLGKQYIDGFR